MTSLISDMLRDGIIMPRQSPYSSLYYSYARKMELGVFVLIMVHLTPSLSATGFQSQLLMSFSMSCIGHKFFQKSTFAPVTTKYVSLPPTPTKHPFAPSTGLRISWNALRNLQCTLHIPSCHERHLLGRFTQICSRLF